MIRPTLKQARRECAKQRLLKLCIDTAKQNRNRKVYELRGMECISSATPRDIVSFHFSNVKREFGAALNPTDSLQLRNEVESELIQHLISIEDDINTELVEQREQEITSFYDEMMEAQICQSK